MKKKNQPTYEINGRVIDAKGRGIPGLRVEAWDKDLIFDDLVGSAITDADGRFHIEFTGAYYRELFLDREPDLFFRVFSGGKLIKSTEDSVLWNVSAGSTSIEIALPWTSTTGGDDEVYTVSGAVVSQDRPGVGGLRVEIVDKNIGQDITLVETVTDESGRYQTSFPVSLARARGKDRPDLQARVFAAATFLAASDVHYNATNHETLNVLLPSNSAGLASEYETLTAALALHYSGRLSDLEESDDRQDITYLAHKSGWDARAVALVALADQFSRRSVDASGAPVIKPAFYYALFRAGLPANADTLYRADSQVVERVWQQAITQAVIPKALEPEIASARDAFRSLGAEKWLTGPALAGTSSLGEMLAVSHLAEPQQKQFVELYALHRTDLPTFWTTVENAFGADTSNRLQVNGKLGLLTVNNAPLIQELHRTTGDNGINDPVELAHQGYHRAAKWSELLSTNISVPKEIPGDTAETKRANYAEYLAAQVRLSYPTAAVAEMVKSGDLAINASEQVHSFLTDNQGKFEVGMMPVQQYIARNDLNVAEGTVKEVQRLQRVYQITSNDRAMSGLLNLGMDAAYHVVSHDKETFVRTFAEDLGGADNAARTYDRSVHVHNAILNIAVTYLTARNGIGLGAPPLEVRQEGANGNGLVLQPTFTNGQAKGGDNVIAYPTLDQLFGEMDFCACDHCRSILSPAAYLVDLLLFIKQPNPTAGQNPQTVLFDRRPDIQHLPLTCENTNTALPYIDVVNETLEYFIANSVQKLSLNGYAGHDTDAAASEDLLASPQFVMDSAYATLRGESFPTPLPFHQALENLRRYFEKFEVSLPLAMERLRKSNDLERGSNPYGWRDVLMEELRLSRSEHELLTDSNAIPLWRMYGFPNGTADADVIAGIPNFPGLSNAKLFTRRVGITYEDIASILQTRFVNPNSDLIPKLERLGVSFAELKKLKETNTPAADAEFDALLSARAVAPDPAEYDNDIKAWVKRQDNYDRIVGIITLTDPTASADPCSFDNLEFRYSRPVDGGDTSNRLGAVEFVRLLRFIRLWKKLGWTIEQTDATLCALFPLPPFPLGADAIDSLAELDAGFLALLPRLGIAVRVMKSLNLTPKRDLLSLLTCWSSLGTHGDSALYRQMFLNPTLLKQDPAFADNGYGEFLKDNTQKLLGHAEALRAAFGLTGDEFSQIAAALGFDADSVDVPYNHPQATLDQTILDIAPGIAYDDVNKRLRYIGVLSITTRDALKAVPGATVAFQTAVDALYAANQATLTPLTLVNISAVYRRGWLARKLKLSVREFLLLVQLTGLDPFATPDPASPANLRIIELAQALKARSFRSSAALYLIWNQDLSGKSAPEPAQVAAFARTLRIDLAAVKTDFAIKDDPDGAIAQNRMTLVYGADAAAFFFGLLSDTLSVDLGFTDPDGTLAVDATRAAVQNAGGMTEAGTPKIAYDDFRKRLSYAGVLPSGTRDAIKLAAGLGAAAFKTAVDDLLLKNQTVINPFFDRYQELRPLYDAYLASPDPVATKRSAVLAQILPELVKQRKRQQALQSISAAAQTDLNFAHDLLDTSARGIALHAAGHNDEPALNDVLALEIEGLSVQFFANDTATGAVIPSPNITSNLDYAPVVGGVGNPLPAHPTPGAAISGVWHGHLEAPESGFFNLFIETDAGATVTLKLEGKSTPLTQNTTLWHNTDAKELRAGSLYAIELTVEKVHQIVRVQWEWTPKGQGRAIIAPRYLYPATLFEPFQLAYLRFLKAAALATTLRLTSNEMAHFATHPDYRVNALGQLDANGQGWLNHLPNEDNLHLANPADAAIAKTLNATLLTPLGHLMDYARIKAEISPDDESVLKILEDPTTAAQPAGLLFALTHWDLTSLSDLLTRFAGNIAGLTHLDLFRNVYDAFELIKKMGISASALIKATTNEPTGDTVRDLQAALRARYDAVDWRSVVQPINDAMRALQRDALVAYILNQMRSHPATAHIDTADKLFEYFLMDVQMEPCMQTSRIRHALSSVQLFIERCLMNLEPNVSSSSILGKQWEWMKRYRVWEANRKVFLYPENWLEPELRDDKSPFFKEIESELLQSDITEESATIALLNYLAKLEEVAKLEPCGIHHVPGGETTNEVDHVIARTAGAHRKYYYRRREDGSWTPWEQIKLDIEDNPVLPVVWKGRLFLFWLRLVKKGPDTGAKPGGTDLATLTLPPNPKITVQAILSWSEYFNGKWQPLRTSDVARPLKIAEVAESDFDRSKLQLSVMFWTTLRGTAVRIIVSNEVGIGNSFFLYNVYSSPELREEKKNRHFAPKRILETTTSALRANYPESTVSHSILDNSIDDRSVEPHHPLEGNPWDAPFFYEDSRHVFYVTTEEHVESIAKWRDVGVVVAPATTVFNIPPLVLQTVATVSDPMGPIIRQPGFGLVDPAPIKWLVTEDAYINHGIGSPGTVSYGNKEIGPAGSQIRSIQKR